MATKKQKPVLNVHTHEPDGITLKLDGAEVASANSSEVGYLLRKLGEHLGFDVTTSSDEEG